jgi:hypothetical protein
MSRESSRSRWNVREPPKHNEACKARKLRLRPAPSLRAAGFRSWRETYRIGFANLAGSGACSTVSSFCRAMTPPIGSLTMSETTTLETL